MTSIAQGYTPELIYKHMSEASAAGASNQQIATALQGYGITAEQASSAYAQARPDLFPSSGSAQTMSDYAETLWPSAPKAPQPTAPTPAPSSGGMQNPYLNSMANDIQRRSGEALGQGLQGIRSHSVGVGGMGGSRQGVAEGAAISGANDNMVGQLAGMYGTAWNGDQNREVQRYGIDQQTALGWGGLQNQRYGMDQTYSLGLGGLANQRYGIDTNATTAQRGQDQSFYLGNQGQNQQFYTAQRGQDLDSVKLGATLFGMGNDGEWSGIKDANSTYQPYTGYSGGGGDGGGTNWAAALGSGMSTYQTGTTNGWWK